jgi:hypothetical protein
MGPVLVIKYAACLRDLRQTQIATEVVFEDDRPLLCQGDIPGLRADVREDRGHFSRQIAQERPIRYAEAGQRLMPGRWDVQIPRRDSAGTS